MTWKSEPVGGTLILLALAFFVGATVSIELPEEEPRCIQSPGYEYTGRDDEGRPTFRYYRIDRCYD